MSRLALIIATFFGLSLTLQLSAHNDSLASEKMLSTLPPKLVEIHNKSSNCVDLGDHLMPQKDFAFHARLDDTTELYGILCEPSAYNHPYAIYLVKEGYLEDAERVLFAEYSLSGGWTGTNILYNAHFDPAAKLLKGFSKGRGLGDCGSQSVFKWNGEALNMIEYRHKETCDEDISKAFPLVYKRVQPAQDK